MLVESSILTIIMISLLAVTVSIVAVLKASTASRVVPAEATSSTTAMSIMLVVWLVCWAGSMRSRRRSVVGILGRRRVRNRLSARISVRLTISTIHLMLDPFVAVCRRGWCNHVGSSRATSIVAVSAAAAATTVMVLGVLIMARPLLGGTVWCRMLVRLPILLLLGRPVSWLVRRRLGMLRMGVNLGSVIGMVVGAG